MPSALFVHNGWPGRFAPIAEMLLQRGWECVLLNGPTGTDIKGARTTRWRLADPLTNKNPLTRKAEADILQGVGAATAAKNLAGSGFAPDLIIGHPGWGEMLFLREVFPAVPQIQIGEFYYHSRGADVGFDKEFETADDLREQARVHARNLALSLSYLDAARIVCPTPFQASLLPAQLRDRVAIIHEGIDTKRARRIEGAKLPLANGVELTADQPVVTFINRYFEPMRGFHVFMRALPDFLARAPTAHVVMVGSDESLGYGQKAPGGQTWKQFMMRELEGRLDPSRVHFIGPVPYDMLLKVFSISSAHVYLTYPFVLSWSLLDAMACECLVVASDTAPVRDVVTDGVNGRLVDFFDPAALSDQLVEACANPGAYSAMRRAARATVVERCERATELLKWQALIDATLADRAPK